MSKAVHQTLEVLGFDTTDKPALRADLAHLRKWRLAVDGAGRATFYAMISTLVTGLLGLAWLALQNGFHPSTGH